MVEHRCHGHFDLAVVISGYFDFKGDEVAVVLSFHGRNVYQ
jgi:hypothetical protein